MLVIADPDEVSVEFFERTANAVAASAGVLLAWTPFAPRVVSQLIQISAVCPLEVVFRGSEDTRALLQAILSRFRVESVRRSVLKIMASRMRELPVNIALALIGMVVGHTHARDVREFTLFAGGTRRSFERHLRNAGFKGAAGMIRSARLMHARECLNSQGASVELASTAAGYETGRALRASCRRYLNCSPSDLRRLSPEAFVERLAVSVMQLR
jgi:transcriptional regulator GlxA family with amidase domain